MNRTGSLRATLLLLLAAPLLAQQQPSSPLPPDDPKHDIDLVDTAPLNGTIAVPLREEDRKQLEKYEIPELAGSHQALGSQLIDGRLPRPYVDYIARSGGTDQRLSLFEGGLAVIKITGAGGTMFKRLVLPDDALKNYLRTLSPERLRTLDGAALPIAAPGRRAILRVYDERHAAVERAFDPLRALPKALDDQVAPLQDLLRAMSEDRTVTTSLSNYEPKVGDQLVGDDHKVYRVTRLLPAGGIVELQCTTQPTKMYVAAKDMNNYFVGKR